VFYHRFYAVHPHDGGENDWKTVAAACLFLAGKVEESPKALRDVVQVSYLWCHRKEQEAALERLKDKASAGPTLGVALLAPRSPPERPGSTSYVARVLTRRDARPQEVISEAGEKILAAERKLLHTLGFEFNVNHPYMPLGLAIKKMRVGETNEEVVRTKELFQVAWNFINDSLRTTLSLQYDASAIAAAAMYLAARFKAAKLPDMGDAGPGTEWWYTKFGTPVDPRVAEDISNQILELYQQSGKSMLADAGLQATTATTAVAAPAFSSGADLTVSAAPAPTGGEGAPEARAVVAAPAQHQAAVPHSESGPAPTAAQPRPADGPSHGGGGGAPHAASHHHRSDREREQRDRERDAHRDRDRDRDRERERDRHGGVHYHGHPQSHHHHHHAGGQQRARSRSRSPRRERDRDDRGGGGEHHHHTRERDQFPPRAEYRPSSGHPLPQQQMERRISERDRDRDRERERERAP